MSRGAKLFKKHCAQCHTCDPEGVKGVNIGPPLFNICGRCSGIYSHKGAGGQPMMDSTIVWTDSQLLEYMKNPRTFAGNASIAMNFPGISKAEDREDILKYLKTLKYPESVPLHTKPPFGRVVVYTND